MVGYEIRNTHTLPRAHDYDKDLLYKLKDDTEDILEQVTDLSLNVPILDQYGYIPASYLPSYVDDVLEYPSYNSLPTLGETGKIYVTTDTDLTYRWSGSTYIEISKSIITGVKGDAESNYRVGNVNLTAANIGLGNVANLDLSKAIKGITRSGTTFTYTCLDGTTGTFTQQDNNTIYSAGTGLSLSGTTFSLALTKTLVTNALGYTPPTLDTNTWRPLGTGANDACAGNDSRLSNYRPASDVYPWAKAATKPSYSWSEITSTPTIPSKTSQLINDSGFITSYTDTKNTTGSTDTDGVKLYLVGAKMLSSYAQTYSNNLYYIGNDNIFYGDVIWGSTRLGSDLVLATLLTACGTSMSKSQGIVTWSTNNNVLYVSCGSGSLSCSKAWSVSSDIRKKDIISDINVSIDDIANAPIFNYKLKDIEDSDILVGTSAQYWKNIISNAVKETYNGYLSLDYGGIALASAIKGAKEIVKLKEENRQLKEELLLLKEQINSILTTINIK